MKTKLRIFGVRQKRLMARLAGFFACAVTYSIETGVEGGFPVMTLAILLILLYEFFKKRSLRRIEREQQLAAEAAAACPAGTQEELRECYVQLRRKELRLEALLYLLFALGFALLLWVLLFADANPLSFSFGVLFVIPGLLLTALGLFLASLLRRKTEKDDLLVFPSSDEIARARKTDHRGEVGILHVLPTRGKPSREDIAARLGRTTRNNGALRWVVIGFFLVTPIVLSVLTITIALIDSSQGWMLVFALFLLSVSVPLSIYLLKINGRQGGTAQARKNLRSGSYSLTADRVTDLCISTENPQALEVCFEKAGRYMIAIGIGNANDYERVKDLIKGDVWLLQLEPDAIPIVFVEEGSSPDES